MDYGVRFDSGGILGLCELISQHREAITFDLLVQGWHVWQVGTPALSWAEFGVWFRFLSPSSQTFQEIKGAQWSPEMHRLTDVLETLLAANWQRGGGKGPKPKPVPRPGSRQKFGTATGIDVVRDRLTFLNGRPPGR